MGQHRLNFLSVLRKINLPQHLLVTFYHCSIKNVLTYGIWVWYSSRHPTPTLAHYLFEFLPSGI